MTTKDYYRALGLDRRASERDIRHAFRALARRYHPDVTGGDKEAEQRFKDISEAYETLSDAEKRRRYDSFGPLTRARAASQATGAQQAGEEPRATSFAFDLFQNVFNPRTGRRTKERSRDVEQPLTIPLEEAYAGGRRLFNVQGEDLCKPCDGAGKMSSGRPCPACGGKGAISYDKRLEVSIPPGVRDGSRIRIAGEGGVNGGGSVKGDLYFRVSVLPHATFRREGDNLHREIDVLYTTLVLGGDVEVETLGRPVRMKIPPMTRSGHQFRLARQGMPNMRVGERGNLFVRVNAGLPRHLQERERRLFEELRALHSGE